MPDPSTTPGTLRNLTPHPVTFHLINGSLLTVPAQQPVPRVTMTRRPVGAIRTPRGDIPVMALHPQPEVRDLPAALPGTWLIVSRVVADSVPWRDDVVFPDDLVRDDAGHVTGARALGRSAARHRPDTGCVHTQCPSPTTHGR